MSVVERLREGVRALYDGVNEPPSYEEMYKVREYRHMIWPLVETVFRESQSAIAEIERLEAERRQLHNTLEALLYTSENCGESGYGGPDPTPWDEARVLLAPQPPAEGGDDA